jgi:MFS family permease
MITDIFTFFTKTGNVLMAAADKWSIHYLMLILTYAGTIICRGLITIEHWNFAMMLILTLVMESSVASMSVLVDATVVAGSVKDGTYGRARLWASVGWGVLAPIAGYILTKFGIHTCFMIFASIYASASIPTFLIPAGLLASKNQHLRKTSGNETSNNPGSGSSSNARSTTAATTTTTNPSTTPAAANESATAPSPLVGNSNNTPNINTNNNVVQLPASVTLGGTTVSRRTSRRSSQHSGQHVITVEVDAGIRRASTQQQTVIVEMPTEGTPPGPIESLNIQKITDIEAVKGDFESYIGKGKQISITASATAASVVSAEKVKEESIWVGLKKLFSDIYVLTFMFIAFLMGIGNGFVGYLFLLLTDLGGSGTLLGLCLAMNCVGEVPLFYYSGALIKKLGVTMSFNLAMAAYVIRLGAYALLPWYPTLWIVLPVELLQGLTFGLAYSAGTVHCRRISPKYLRSTVQSIFSGLYTGIGAGIGGLAGGMIYSAFSGQTMYIVATVVLMAGWAAANFTNLIQYLRKGVRGGFKRAKRVGHHMKSFYSMTRGGSSGGSISSTSDGSSGLSSARGSENVVLPEESRYTAATVPVVHETSLKNSASPIV